MTDVNKMLARLAKAELAKSRTAAPSKDALAADPARELARLGIDVELVTKHLVGHALGDDAPQGLKDLAATSKLESLQKRLDALTEDRPDESQYAAMTQRELRDAVVAENKQRFAAHYEAEELQSFKDREALVEARMGKQEAAIRRETLAKHDDTYRAHLEATAKKMNE